MVETESNGGNGNVAVSPADVRPALAQAAAASLDEIQQALLDAALGAAREHWATFTCGDCGKKIASRCKSPMSAHASPRSSFSSARASAVPPRPRSRPSRTLPDSVEAVKRMSWTDLQAVFALQFADDIATVASGEAGSVIRERLAGVGAEGRRLLRETLDDLEATPSA